MRCLAGIPGHDSSVCCATITWEEQRAVDRSQGEARSLWWMLLREEYYPWLQGKHFWSYHGSPFSANFFLGTWVAPFRSFSLCFLCGSHMSDLLLDGIQQPNHSTESQEDLCRETRWLQPTSSPNCFYYLLIFFIFQCLECNTSTFQNNGWKSSRTDAKHDFIDLKVTTNSKHKNKNKPICRHVLVKLRKTQQNK